MAEDEEGASYDGVTLPADTEAFFTFEPPGGDQEFHAFLPAITLDGDDNGDSDGDDDFGIDDDGDKDVDVAEAHLVGVD